ncbi:MAG: heavy-metal-associated domain-containing protein [Bacteroidota bacterium]
MKRTAIKLIILPLLLLFCTSIMAQTATKEAKIKTGFHCPNGKANIETEIVKEPGVKTVVADLDTKIVTIVYDVDKTNQDKLVAAIEKLGYRTEYTPAGTTIKSACTHNPEQAPKE